MGHMRIRWKRAGQPNWALPFFAGFFAGAALVYLNAGTFLTENGLLSRIRLERLSDARINENAFFLYVLGKRFKLIWLLIILATTFVGIVTTYLFALWMGVCGGVIGMAAVMRYGFKGVLLLAGGMLPHFVCYVPAFWMLADCCLQLCMRLHYPVVDYTEMHTDKGSRLALLGRFLLLHGVVIIGAVLESYVNPHLLIDLLKIF